jgi:hypothetical protein
MRHAGENDIDRSQQSDPHRRETNAEIVARRCSRRTPDTS